MLGAEVGMGGSKQMKTANLGIVLQLTTVTRQGTDGRSWMVHDVERNRGFRVEVLTRVFDERPPGEKALGRPWTEDDVEGAIGLAIERFLSSSPEIVAGPLYDVQVTSRDLYDFAKLK
jgi:hypothetical protein